MSDDTALTGENREEEPHYTSPIPHNPFAAPYRDSGAPATPATPATPQASPRDDTSAGSDPAASNYPTTPASRQSLSASTSAALGATQTSPQSGVSQGSIPQMTHSAMPYGTPQPSTPQPSTYPHYRGNNSPYAPPVRNVSPTARRQRRGPGWLAMVATSVVVAVLASGLTVGGLWSLDLIGNHPQLVSAHSSDGKPEVAPVVDSQAATADWKAVNEAVGKSVVLIQAIGASGDGGTGSGVIIDKDAHVVTNYHVIAPVYQTGGEGQLTVTLADSRVYHATVVGVDVTTDLAVIKIQDPPQDLTIARLGSSDNLFVGQQVAAIGAPLGLRSTMTTGIISALDRPTVVANRKIFDEVGGAVYTNAIQVDASINPGNSGGPLFDAQGRVIGINSSIISLTAPEQRQAGSIGLGFAIPVDLAKKIAQEIIATGSVRHALLGINVAPTYTMVDGTRVTGAEVKSIQPGSKLPEAGLQAGDVILSINGNPVVDSSSLIGYVRRYSPGDTVTLQVARLGKRLQLTGELVEAK